jgi:large subunit ribosomal protein L21e
MVKTSKGFTFRTRSLFKKSPRAKGLPPLGRLLVNYQVGDKVDIIIEPSQQKGMPHRRFHGKVGEVQRKQGNAYIVKLNDLNKEKTLIVRPEHIRRHKL